MKTIAVSALLLCASGAFAQDDEYALRLSELAYSIPLEPTAEKPVLRMLVPEEVYSGVRSAELSDVRVFNDDGEQVPFAIRPLDDPREVESADRALPFFPLRAKDGELPPIEGISVALDHGDASARIDLQALLAEASDPDAEAPISAYILDASGIDRPIAALRITLEAIEPDYVLPVAVESSDDLASFRVVDGNGMLVDLEYGGARIARDRIELDGVRAPFLRILPKGPDASWPGSIAAVVAELEPEHEPAPRVTTRVTGTEREGEPGVYDFDLEGFVPVDRARVRLPQDNTLIEATLGSSDTLGDDGQVVFRGPLYRVLRDGERLESPAVDFTRRSHRHWVLRVDTKGGGLASAMPELELSRHPDQLLFVARGSAPFHLAYGHLEAGRARFSPNQVLELMPSRDRERHESDIVAGQQETRAGEAALTAPPPAPPYKRYLLWAVLIAGAAGLCVGAVRMLRE